MHKPLQPEAPQPYAPEVLLGESPATNRLRLQIERIAPHFRVALLIGEAGSGKRTIASAMHRLSPTPSAPLVTLSAAAFTSNQIRSGTLYLTAVDTLDIAAQLILLRALRSLERDTRVIIASRCDLKGMVATGRLRSDLYECIGNLEIRVPALRDRLDDLERIARSMLGRMDPVASLQPATLASLRQHAWPGNLAELHTLLHSVAANGVIEAAHLPAFQAVSQPVAARLEEVMYRHVMEVLEGCAGNKLRAAELLGISRSTLYRMLESRQPIAV